MAAIITKHECKADAEATGQDRNHCLTEAVPIALQHKQAALPWIGTLSNPHLGPMVVVGDSGYLAALCTAGDLLRGCRNWWRAAQEYS